MSAEPQFESLQPSSDPRTGASHPGDLQRLRDVLVELSVEVGRTRMTVGETLELRPGTVISLERMAGEPVDLLVNGRRIARGEVVVVDDEFGLRITEIGVVEEGRQAGPAQTAGAPTPAGDGGEVVDGELVDDASSQAA
jgi:flagellar motor switch protein FliN/FliY